MRCPSPFPVPDRAPPPRHTAAVTATFLIVCVGISAPAFAVSGDAYPFEGTWVQQDHVCAPGAVRVRTYTAKDVTSPRGRCAIRRVTAGSGAFELVEECRHERNQTVTEIIHMRSPDSLTMRRQLTRLKIPRPLRFVRCSAAAPGAAAPAQKPGTPPRVTPPAKP